MVLAKLLYAGQWYWHQIITNPVFIKTAAKIVGPVLLLLLKLIGSIFTDRPQKRKRRNGY